MTPVYAASAQAPRLPAAQQSAPRIVRGQAPEEPAPRLPVLEPRPAPLRLPSPEELGVVAAKPAAASDADALHRRLEQLGATCLHLEKQTQGGYLVCCLLPTAQPGRSHRIDATAAGSTEALRLVVERAEAWAAGK